MTEQTVAGPRAPSAAGVRAQVDRFAELWLGAMFLQSQAYAYERDEKNAFGNGLLYVSLVGVIVAIAGILGAALRFATNPTPEAIKNTVLIHLQAMPFYTELPPAIEAQFMQGFDGVWDLFGSVFMGYPTNEAAFVALAVTIITTPLSLIIGWLVYGGLVHLIARGWNPETSFAEMLAPLALAFSPQLLNLLGVFPAVSVSNGVIALWSFICSIFAIQIAYQTSSRRAVWGAIFPILVISLVLFVTVALGLWALGAGRSG